MTQYTRKLRRKKKRSKVRKMIMTPPMTDWCDSTADVSDMRIDCNLSVSSHSFDLFIYFSDSRSY